MEYLFVSSVLGRISFFGARRRIVLFLSFSFLFASCVIYHKTADIDVKLKEFQLAVNINHTAAQKAFDKQEVYFNEFRNPAKEEPYASAKQKLEIVRERMQAITSAKRIADDAYHEFVVFSKGKERIASNTEEWEQLKEIKKTMQAIRDDLEELFNLLSLSANEYEEYMEANVTPFVRRFFVADYLDIYKEAGNSITKNQQKALEVVKKHRDILDGISAHVENKDRDPYPRLYEQLRVMEKELGRLTRTAQDLRTLTGQFVTQTNGFTEILSSFPEWTAIDKLDRQIRDLLDEVQDVNDICKSHVNQFESIIKQEGMGEIDAPTMLRGTEKYLREFNQKLSALNLRLSNASDEEQYKGLSTEEDINIYRQQLDLIKGYIVELERLRTEINLHYEKLNIELKGKKKLWIGPGMAAWDALDSLRARTDRVNTISQQVSVCLRKIQNLKE